MDFLSKNILFLRRQKGWSQEDLADILKVKRNTISNYESNVSKPPFLTLKELTRIFNITMHELVDTDLSEQKAAINTAYSGSRKRRRNPISKPLSSGILYSKMDMKKKEVRVSEPDIIFNAAEEHNAYNTNFEREEIDKIVNELEGKLEYAEKELMELRTLITKLIYLIKHK